jgi:hypothetical protein
VSLVVGIYPGADPQEIQKALQAQQAIDVSKVRVLTGAAPSQAHEESLMDFLHVNEARVEIESTDTMTRETGIMTDSGGTGVPGIGGTTALTSFFSGASANYLGNLGVPSDEADNFNTAIAEGRCVVACDVDGDPSTLASAFKSAGLKNVRTY